MEKINRKINILSQMITKILTIGLSATIVVTFFEKLTVPLLSFSSFGFIKLLTPLIVILSIKKSKKGIVDFLNQPSTGVFLGFILTVLLSAVFSPNPDAGLRETVNYLTLFLLYLAFTLNAGEPKKTNFFLKIYFALLLISIFFRLLYLVLPELHRILISNLLEPYIFHNFYFHVSVRNQLMFLDATSVAYPIFVLWVIKSKLSEPLKGLLYSGIFISILLTNSRTYIAGAMVFVVLHKILFKSRRALMGWKWMIPVFAAGVLLSSALMGRNIIDRYVSTVTNDLQTLSGRVLLGNQAIYLASQSPWFGIGPRQFATSTSKEAVWDSQFENYLEERTISTEYAAPTAYSILTIAAESGYPALVMQLLLWTIFIIQDFRRYRHLSPEKKLTYFHLSFCFYIFLLPSIIDTPTSPEYFTTFIIRGLLNGIH